MDLSVINVVPSFALLTMLGGYYRRLDRLEARLRKLEDTNGQS